MVYEERKQAVAISRSSDGVEFEQFSDHLGRSRAVYDSYRRPVLPRVGADPLPTHTHQHMIACANREGVRLPLRAWILSSHAVDLSEAI